MEAANLSDTTAVMVMVKTKVFCGDAFLKNNSRAITSKNLHPIPFETCLFFVQCHNLSCVLLSLRLSKWELQTIAQSVECFLEPPKVRAFFFEDFMYIHHFEYLYVIVQCISKNYILNIIKQQVNKVHYFAHPSDGFQVQPFQEIICLPVHPSFALNLNSNNNNSSSSNNNNNKKNKNKEQTITGAPSFFFVSTLFYKQRLGPRVLFCPPPPATTNLQTLFFVSSNIYKQRLGPRVLFWPHPPPTTILQTKTGAPCVVLTPPL